ncbi:nucleotide exchange factor GrpE [Candidatus Gottesmanbacteria bacterium]|nr:nucleotide exchange factor GrpE [Candidatus Gottesmanbacteria bacterium]
MTKKDERIPEHVEEWKTKYLRALADYQNLERRVRQERQELRERLSEEIIHSLLVYFDEIQKAEKHVKDPGLTLVVKRLDAWLAYHKVKQMDVLHKQFNPHEMECVEVVEGNKDNEVAEEVRPGYMIGDKVLRVAQVKVGKLPA